MGRVTKTESAISQHLCGECSLAHEVQEHWNRALDDHYICVRCSYSNRSRLKSEQACEHFKL